MSRWRSSHGRRLAAAAAAGLVALLSLLVLAWHVFGHERPLGSVPAAALPRVLGAAAFLAGAIAVVLGVSVRRRAVLVLASVQVGLALLGVAWPYLSGGETQDVI